jgi:hypothetical protein
MIIQEIFTKHNIEIYLGIGLVFTSGYIISAQLEKRGRSKALYEALRGPRTLKDKILTPFVYLFAAIVFTVFWPFVLIFAINDRIQSKKYEEERIIQKERDRFKCKPEYLMKQSSIEEIEEENIVYDPLGLSPKIAFGHLNPAWVKFKDQIQENEELWTFHIPAEEDIQKRSIYSMWSMSGVARINNQKVLEEFIYESN